MKDKYDVIIVGCGLAGLYAALQFDQSTSVLMLSKKELTLSNSSLAQGGVAAVLDKEHDDFRLHLADTLIAGGYENDLKAVKVLVSEGPDDVQQLINMGVDFDKDKNGEPQMTLEGGHCRRRIVHHKDSTGFEIVKTLLSIVQSKPNIKIAENTMLYKLTPVSGGFHAGLLKDGKGCFVASSFVIMASGGVGRVYKYTTNSAIATGDGISIAYDLGAKIKNLHYIQFHPTAFAAKEGRERFLISEAVRGEGARLLNCSKEQFMHRYDERLELAPRDVVSRAIILESRRTGSEKFYLDITHKGADFLKNRFPMIYGRCLEEGIDITKECIPVFPCHHYLMGGIAVDTDSRTNVDRLYAVGECACTGVHGANRLASNSLLEAMVFGRRAAQDIKRRMNMGMPPVSPVTESPNLSGAPLPCGLRTQIRSIMQDSHFVIPNKSAAEKGLKKVDEIRTRLRTGNFEITPDYLEAKSLADIAWLVLREVCTK